MDLFGLLLAVGGWTGLILSARDALRDHQRRRPAAPGATGFDASVVRWGYVGQERARG